MYVDPENCDAIVTDADRARRNRPTGIIFWVTVVMVYYRSQTAKYIALLFYLLVTVSYAARFCDGNASCPPVDVVTVYFLVWQYVSLTWAWQLNELPLFSLRLHNVASCLLLALFTFSSHEVIFRYFPTWLRFLLIFLWAITDT